MAQPNANTLAHLEWLGFVQPTGLVVSAPALDKAGAVLQRSDREGQRRLQAAVECRRSGSGDEPSALLPDFEAFARTVLGWNFSPRGHARGSAAPMPEDLSLHVPDYGEIRYPTGDIDMDHYLAGIGAPTADPDSLTLPFAEQVKDLAANPACSVERVPELHAAPS